MCRVAVLVEQHRMASATAVRSHCRSTTESRGIRIIDGSDGQSPGGIGVAKNTTLGGHVCAISQDRIGADEDG